MTFIIVVITIVVQRFLRLNSYSHQVDWASPYFKWMSSKINRITVGHELLGLILLVVPIVVAAAVLFGLVYGVLGVAGYAFLQCLVVWYCFDARDIDKEPYDPADAKTLLLNRYQYLFAYLFWYGLFGPVGLVLYIAVSHLAVTVPEQVNNALKICFLKVQGILDWLPVRLLGLSFALMGDFGAVFKSWRQHLSHGTGGVKLLIIEWGRAALGTKSDVEPPIESVIRLIDHALIIWLVVFLLISIGNWLGIIYS